MWSVTTVVAAGTVCPSHSPENHKSRKKKKQHKKEKNSTRPSPPGPSHLRQDLSSVKSLSMCPTRPRELESRLLGSLSGPCKQARYLDEASPPGDPKPIRGVQICPGEVYLL